MIRVFYLNCSWHWWPKWCWCAVKQQTNKQTNKLRTTGVWLSSLFQEFIYHRSTLLSTLLRLSCCVLGYIREIHLHHRCYISSCLGVCLICVLRWLIWHSTALSDTMNRSSLSGSLCATWLSGWSRFTKVNASVRLLQISELHHIAGSLLDVVASRRDLPLPLVTLYDLGLSDHRLLQWSVPVSQPDKPVVSVVCRRWHQLDVITLSDALRQSQLCRPEC